jgi:general stress protein 26
MARKSEKEHLHDLVRGFNTAMLVTRTGSECLHARPMSVADVDDAGDIWFTTSIDSGKVSEMLHDRHVCVIMQGSTRYLSISGRAQVFSDAEKAADVWSEAWRPWFPGGPSDAELVLVKVVPEEAEYWDLSGIKGVRYVYEAVKHVLKGVRMSDAHAGHLSHHAKMELRAPEIQSGVAG